MTETAERPLDLKGAAAFLCCKPSYVYQLCFYRKIPFYKNGKRLIFKESELRDYIFRNKVPADYELAEKADEILNR
jgi:hypothetical protein